MSEDTRPAGGAHGLGGAPAAQAPEVSGPTDVDALKSEIDATRQQLGRTVDELSSRLDVPARAKENVARAKDTAVETYRESPPIVIGGALGLVGVVVGLVVWRRKRASTRAASRRKR